MSEIFTIKIGGQAGQGIKSAGLMLAKVASRSGLNIYNYTEYPSLIRGGHNVMQINISKDKIPAPSLKTDLLIALNQETINRHLPELLPGSGVLFNAKHEISLSPNEGIDPLAIPLSELANQAGGKELLTNTVALGSTIAILGADPRTLSDLITEEFADKGTEVIELNKIAAETGYKYAKENFPDKIQTVLKPSKNGSPKMIANGNEAVALGAIAAGVQFAAVYPMSPISNILHVLAAHQEEFGYVYKQPEDEIAAINMAIGASFAGARSMTATSGGGFCLMAEGYGLAAMTETPLVIIEGMRPGPATGLPTWSDQGDLQFILHSHQGDFPRIVLAAGDAEEAYYLTMDAFRLADKYQTPVVLLIDKNICEDEQSLAFPDPVPQEANRPRLITQQKKGYCRYTLTDNGISPRAIPGSGNFFIANSYAHDEEGFTTEEAETVTDQVEKKMRKLRTCVKEDLPDPKLFGPRKADLTIISWGSNKRSILQAIKGCANVNFLYLTWFSPFPTEAVRNILADAGRILDIECNHSGQLAALIREKTGIEITDKMLRSDGRPFYPEEIEKRILSVLKK